MFGFGQQMPNPSPFGPTTTFGPSQPYLTTPTPSAFGGGTTFGFGSTPNPSPFGTTTTNPAYGGSAFGSTSSAFTTTGFGSTPTTTAMFPSTYGTGSTTSSMFGTQLSQPSTSMTMFGTQTPSTFTSPFGYTGQTSGFGQTMGQPTVGTGNPPWRPTPDSEPTSGQLLQQTSITCMEAYKNKSFEELRIEDYTIRKQGGMWSASSSSSNTLSMGPAFGTQHNITGGPFGGNSTTGSSLFGGTTSTPTSFSFNSNPATSSMFGGMSNTGSSLFSSPFGNTTSSNQTSMFGGHTPSLTTNTFGSTPSIGFGSNSLSSHTPSFNFSGTSFGHTTPSTSTSLFGSTQPSSAYNFGHTNTTGSLFSTTPTTGSLFGSTSHGTSSSLFSTSTPSLGLGFTSATPSLGTPSSTGMFNFSGTSNSTPSYNYGSNWGFNPSTASSFSNSFLPTTQSKQATLTSQPFGTVPALSPQLMQSAQTQAATITPTTPKTPKPVPSSHYKITPRSSSKIRPRGFSPSKPALFEEQQVIPTEFFVPRQHKKLVIEATDEEEVPLTRTKDLRDRDTLKSPEASPLSSPNMAVSPPTSPRVAVSMAESPSIKSPVKEATDTSKTISANTPTSPVKSPAQSSVTSPPQSPARSSPPSSPVHKPVPKRGNIEEQTLRSLNTESPRSPRSPTKNSDFPYILPSSPRSPNRSPRELPKLTKPGYFTLPSMAELAQMSSEELAAVEDFTVGLDGVGQVLFLGRTDVRRLDLDSIVEFKPNEIEVYPDSTFAPGINKPSNGKGLNKAAIVTLQNVWPRAKNTNTPKKDDDSLERYEQKIKKSTKKSNAKFIKYDRLVGEWMFQVEHF